MKNSQFVSSTRWSVSLVLFLAAVALLAGCNGSSTPPPAVSISISSPTASVQTAMTQQFSATVSNTSNTAVTWQVNGVTGGDTTHGTINASGLYTAPTAVPSPATVTVTAVAQADTSKTSSSTVTITAPPITVTVSPKTANVQVSHTQQFTAMVANTSNTAATWQVNGVTGGDSTHGTINASGLYTAPTAVPSPATVTVKAISQADATKSDTATVTVAAAPPPITVTVSPKTPTVGVTQTQQFIATVTNTSNTAVTWQVNGTTGGNSTVGTIATTGLYTAPAVVPSPATVTVTAISQADSTKSDSATVTITTTSAVTVTISPKRGGLTAGQSQTFVATVVGSSNTSVTWEVDGTTGGNSTVGTITAGGVYTAPNSGGVHNIVARSVADATAASAASVFGVTDLAGVYTYHNDNLRDGVNSKEYALTTATVTSATFGKLFSCPVDGAVYAQPLWVANVNFSGVKHNALIAVTQHDTIYVFDADATLCSTLWTKSLLASGETWASSNDTGCSDLVPDVGIVGTPVIDPATNTIYLVTKSKITINGTFIQRVHALDLITGNEKFNGPTVISGSVNSNSFDPLRNNQRAGLALANGKVYVAWASHCDIPNYVGWLFSYTASDLTVAPNVFTPAPHKLGQESGIWMAGGAPASDSSNNVYLITGNGTFDANSSTSPNDDYGDSILKLATSGGISVLDYFTPNDFMNLQSGDVDLGSGGAAVLLDPSSGPHPHLLIGGGKEGILYLLNRDSMGHTSTNDANAVQLLNTGGVIFATPAIWQNHLYIGASYTWLESFTFNTTLGTFGSATSHSPAQYNFPGATPSVSASGATNGVVWALETSSYCTNQSSSCGPAILHAYDATNLATELWSSSANSGDAAGFAVKFTVPTVANGKVYIGTRGNDCRTTCTTTPTSPGEIDVYGLKP